MIILIHEEDNPKRSLAASNNAAHLPKLHVDGFPPGSSNESRFQEEAVANWNNHCSMIGRVAELADARDLKSRGHSPWGFESPLGY